MALQTKAALRVRTPRVKSISDAEGYGEVLVCLFTGEIQLYNKDTLKLTRSARVSEAPIRTGVIATSMDWILLGTDSGNIIIVDLGNLSVLDQVLAHDDFIRKIVLDEKNKRFLTVSDDNTAKLWSLERTISCIRRYKGKHFMMDACFSPSDHGHFLAVSLDGKAYLYSVQHERHLRVFKGHEGGINSIAFITSEIFVTGSDDHSIIVWDYKRGTQVTRLRGHTNNINCLKKLKVGFVSCSEDSTVRFWNEDFKVVDIRNLAGRVWAALERDGKVFLGSDEELVVFNEQRVDKMAVMSDNRIFYNEGCSLRAIKLEEEYSGTKEMVIKDLGSFKDLGSLEDGFTKLSVTPNGKLLGVSYLDYFILFSTLGLRKKLTLTGSDLAFLENESFVFKDGESLVTYKKFEEENRLNVPGLESLLVADESIFIVNRGNTCVLDRAALISGEDEYILHEFDVRAQKAICFGALLVLIADRLFFYDTSFTCIASYDYSVSSFCIKSDVLFFSTQNHSFYCISVENSPHIFPMKYVENILGAQGNSIFFLGATPMGFIIDAVFIEFQKTVLRGEPAPVDEGISDKAIAFYESLGQHEHALELCRNEYQKFEILLKLGNLNEALKLANSPIKYNKLGRAYLKAGMLGQAAECFYKSNDLNSLLFVDVFADRKYLQYVGATAAQQGIQNLAFMAYFKGKNYRECCNLLRGTHFCKTFAKFYCSN